MSVSYIEKGKLYVAYGLHVVYVATKSGGKHDGGRIRGVAQFRMGHYINWDGIEYPWRWPNLWETSVDSMPLRPGYVMCMDCYHLFKADNNWEPENWWCKECKQDRGLLPPPKPVFRPLTIKVTPRYRLRR